jgi:hypothetical protein
MLSKVPALLRNAAVASVMLAPGLAHAGVTRSLCEGENRNTNGNASVSSHVLNGIPQATTAEFTPMFHSTVSAVAPRNIPDVAKANDEPNIGAFPAAKIYYQYLTMGDGRHTLPAHRLRLEVPVYAGGESSTVFFKVAVGSWTGGKLVNKSDISGIVGVPDVPIFGVDLWIRPFDGRQPDLGVEGLEASLRQVDHVEIEIHEGSVGGPLREKGTIVIASQHERLSTVAGALEAALAQMTAGGCKPDS